MRMRIKLFIQLGGTVEGFRWRIPLQIKENGTFNDKGSINILNTKERYYGKDNIKIKLRKKDKNWVIYHIPSSIWWHTVIHHDWDNGGTMYLLSHKEHILIHRI